MESKTTIKMKIPIIALLAIFIPVAGNAQLPVEREGFTKTENGYIFFVHNLREFLTFVPVNADSIKNDLSNFDTKKLGIGYQINDHAISTYSLMKFGKTYRLENYRNDTMKITIVPITLTYSIGDSQKIIERKREAAYEDECKILNKVITVRNIGGVSIQIIASTPKISYYDVLE